MTTVMSDSLSGSDPTKLSFAEKEEEEEQLLQGHDPLHNSIKGYKKESHFNKGLEKICNVSMKIDKEMVEESVPIERLESLLLFKFRLIKKMETRLFGEDFIEIATKISERNRCSSGIKDFKPKISNMKTLLNLIFIYRKVLYREDLSVFISNIFGDKLDMMKKRQSSILFIDNGDQLRNNPEPICILHLKKNCDLKNLKIQNCN